MNLQIWTTKNLKVQTNQRTAIAQTLGTIYNHLETNKQKFSATISHYNYQTENLMPKLQPQITRFASISSTNKHGKLELGRNCLKKSTFKFTINKTTNSIAINYGNPRLSYCFTKTAPNLTKIAPQDLWTSIWRG